MVNLEWYRTFKAIYQHGNLTNASKELLISQPNVSIQLASLESYVGHKLFERNTRKLTPTKYGHLLYTKIVEPIENLERVEIDFRRSTLSRQRSLKIGAPIEYAQNILLDRLRNCDIEINLQFGHPLELLDSLENKKIDIAILTQEIEKNKLTLLPLTKESFVVMAHESYDTKVLQEYLNSNDEQMIEEWLLKQRWIAYDSKLSIIRRFWLENFNKRPSIKPHYIIPDINMILKAIRLNYGISIVSDMITNQSLENHEIKVIWKGRKETTNQLWLGYIPGNIDNDEIVKIKEILDIP